MLLFLRTSGIAGLLLLFELASRYGIELQLDSIPLLCAEHGRTHPMLWASQ